MNAPRTLIVPCQVGPDLDSSSGLPTLEAHCHQCGGELTLCQPLPEEPDELLGVCHCGAWHYVAYRPHRAEILVAYLPLKTLLSAPEGPTAEAIGEAPSEGGQLPRSRRRA